MRRILSCLVFVLMISVLVVSTSLTHSTVLAQTPGNRIVYVANGYGTVAAVDPQSGKTIWTKNLDVPVRAAPTAVGDRLYVITIDGRFYCLNGVDGTEVWTARGLPQTASLMTSTSPAVEGDVVVVPYPSGDIIAYKTSDGTAVWTENLSRTRQTSQIASMSDAARPAIDNGVVFAVGHAGRMIAAQAKNGDRLWSATIPSSQPPCVAGDTIFVVDTSGRLLALARSSGKTKWTVKLPEAKSWAGPVLAAGSPLSPALGRVPVAPAPVLGQHTDEVLAEVLGLSAAELGALHDRRLIAGATGR